MLSRSPVRASIGNQARERVVTARTDRGVHVADRCVVADTLRTRLVGLLGRPQLEPGEGLLLRPCSSVHSAFMRFPIDVVFLDGQGAVLRVVDSLRPWRAAWTPRAKAALELQAGAASDIGLSAGDQLMFVSGER